MKRFAFILFCLLCAAGGVALGRYVWSAPVEDAPVLRSSAKAATQGGGAAKGVQESLAAVRSGPRRAALILSLSARGGSRNLPALIEACAGDEAALQFLAETWLRAGDPGAFAKALSASQAIQGSRRRHCTEVLSKFMQKFGEKAPDEAWETAESLTGVMRRLTLSGLADQRLQADPAAGLQFLKEHPGVVGQAAPDLKPGQGAELLPLVRALPESLARRGLMFQVLKELPLAEAMQELNTGKDAMTFEVRTGVFRAAAVKSLDEVIAWHDAATGSERYAAARAVGSVLLNKDPAAAVQWASENMSGNYRNVLLGQAAEKLDDKDPAAAAAARALLPESFRPAVK